MKTILKTINSKSGHIACSTLTFIMMFTVGIIFSSGQAYHENQQEESTYINETVSEYIYPDYHPAHFSTFHTSSEAENNYFITPDVVDIEIFVEEGIEAENLNLFLDEIIEIIIFIDEEPNTIIEEERPTRDDPIYEVFKNAHPVKVPVDLQWFIRDLADEHDFCERVIFGLILGESTFNADAVSPSGKHFGLTQISPFWIKGANIPRLTDDWSERDLFNPHDNLITLMELWLYARDVYDLNTDEELDMKRLIYWHNTGQNPQRINNWPFSNLVFRFADELVEIQYEFEQEVGEQILITYNILE